MHTHEPYLKAAGSDRMARYYDLMARFGMPERRIKRRVIALTRLAPDGRLLDLGCGTGTLVLLARRRLPRATVIGVDGDPTILAIARRKAARERVAVQFDEAMAYALPYADGSFDAVTATLMLHHLTADQQPRALDEVARVLRPGGRLVIADFAPPHNALMRFSQRLPLGPGRLHRAHGRHATEASAAHGHEHADAPDGGMIGHRQESARLVADLLRGQGWQRAAPSEPHMSLMGTIALDVFTRPA